MNAPFLLPGKLAWPHLTLFHKTFLLLQILKLAEVENREVLPAETTRVTNFCLKGEFLIRIFRIIFGSLGNFFPLRLLVSLNFV